MIVDRDAEIRLRDALRRHAPLAIAVSGGVDSVTLAYIAHRLAPNTTTVIHAVSPAVPRQATDRVRAYARRERWRLVVTEAGEFDDPAYRANPADRCYYCKANLYERIRALTSSTIASGANVDDLDDYRPGLVAAAERNVVHPYIEASVDKAGVRALARRHGLCDVAKLPAQPCLSSRVETGIAIDAADLAFIDGVENALRGVVRSDATVRCRITRLGAVVELDGAAQLAHQAIESIAKRLCAEQGRTFAGVRAYRRGSAFLKIAVQG